MRICLSCKQTLATYTLDELGAGFAEKVKRWQGSLTSILINQVSFYNFPPLYALQKIILNFPHYRKHLAVDRRKVNNDEVLIVNFCNIIEVKVVFSISIYSRV